MKVGLFDFKRKRETHPDDRPDAVSVEVTDAAFPEAETRLSADDVADLWDSLASDLDEMSLDQLDDQLAAPPSTDPELQSWAESDEDAVRAFVDSFVATEEQAQNRQETPPTDPEDLGVPELEAGQEFDLPSDGDFDASAAARYQNHEVEELPGAESFYAGADAEFDPDDFDDSSFIADLAKVEEAEGSSLSETESQAPASSGVVSDEVVLSLMHAGVIRVAQVYDASRHRRPGEPLWRAMLQLDEVDRGTLLAEVALQAGYIPVELGQDFPVPSVVENMRAAVPAEAVLKILQEGGLPVEVGIDPETLEYQLILAADDPASPELLEALQSLSVKAEVRYMPTAAADVYLDAIWPDRPRPSRREVHAQTAESLREPSEQPKPRSDRDPEDSTAVDRAKNRPWPKAGPASDTAKADETIQSGVPVPPDASEADPGKAQDIALLDRRAKKDRVVAALFTVGVISLEHVEKAVQKFRQDGGKEAIWRILSTIPGVDREKIFTKAAKVYAFPRAEVGKGYPDHEFVMLIMQTIAEERREALLALNLLPYEYDIDPETGGARLIFVTHDPARSEVHRLLGELRVGRFELRYASEQALAGVITDIFPKRNEYLDRMSVDEPAFDLGDYQLDEPNLVDESALEAEISKSGLINLFEASLVEAVRQGASDLHIYPNAKRFIEIHFRVDGRLRRWHVDEKVQGEAFIAVVKDNSTNVDRFERDAAQDGFIQRKIDDVLIRFRVSILPIASANQEIRAESIVLRVLDDRKVLTDLTKLGMLDSAMERMNLAISQPHGMVILTGPTGSGKSTTLVAALSRVISPEVNVLTIEDPVEYIIKGVRQIKLSHKLDLEDAIRAVLRHDPDVVMVGEMRDKATADLAIKLANTGHLTFSTLHTNNAPSAVSRLYKMGVEPFLLAYAINLIVAQRLIRQLCPACKKPVQERDKVLMTQLGFSPDEVENLVVMGPGKNQDCPTCHGGGYKGRRAISETLYFTKAIRHLVAESGEDIDEEAILNQAVKEGMLTLQDCARQVVREGGTSIDEMMRVTATE